LLADETSASAQNVEQKPAVKTSDQEWAERNKLQFKQKKSDLEKRLENTAQFPFYYQIKGENANH
jgi:hypothetical protein